MSISYFVAEKPGITNVWKDTEDEGDLYKPIWRWAEAFQLGIQAGLYPKTMDYKAGYTLNFVTPAP